jgi:murein DD-endopeptidase MepM/ murein hydrolase activator NlpD
MKRILLPLLALLALTAPRLAAQSSVGNYRLPYVDGVDAFVIDDPTTHPLTNRIDFQGANSTPPTYPIWAAAAGTVRYFNDTPGGGSVNYIWIEHSNGEWTGYLYLQQNSITAAGITNNMPVTAGQPLGFEGAVGSPGGQRLRFAVLVPNNPNVPPPPATGMFAGTARRPVFCNREDSTVVQNQTVTAASCAAFEFSYGTYRLPYTNGVTLRVSQDHLTHNPNKTRYDLTGESGGIGTNYPIVAAAAGTVMIIVDNNNVTCTTNNCGAFNNYVWLRHSNGEWSKYTHFIRGTVRTNAGLTVGDNVVAGQFLGNEGAVGAASGVHLHFEVGVPDNTNSVPQAIDIPNGGFLRGDNRIPLFCGVPGNILYRTQQFVAGNCGGGGCANDLVMPAKILRTTDAYVADNTVDTGNNSISVDTYASLALLAGNKVTLRPGFHALSGSYVRAAIKPCVNPP